MPNFEFKKDCVSATALNLALDSIVIVYLRIYIPGRKDFVLWYLRLFGVKRLRRDKELANRHWAPCATDSAKAWSQTRRAFDDFCVELGESVAQEGQWRFASSLSFNLISKRGEPHNLTLSNDISRS